MFKYALPDENNNPVSQEIDSNSLIIIGANGSGKSKLGAWIEENDTENVHRIGAQRNLNFNEYIPLKSYEQAKNSVLFGNEKEHNKGYRWNWGHLTTTLLNDYENVLAALIALNSKQTEDFVKECKRNEKEGVTYPKVPKTVIDELLEIWDIVFPQRSIKIEDSKVIASFKQAENKDTLYKGSEMSDGERVALYLIAQCLSVPANKVLIVDEPELHLHRSIMNRLWCELEKKRSDCLFIYITHDTNFAALHSQAKKIWVKEYDGCKWTLEEINSSELPEQLMLDIMGNRKKVIFVEGTDESYDTKLYSEIYKSYYVIPCGGCSNVIARTKAMRDTPQLHDIECFGIIDRDYRGEAEINAYREHHIYTLKVAEVENLFLVEELLNVVANLLAITDNRVVENIKKYIIENRFSCEVNRQICEAVVSEIKYQLSIIELSKKNEIEASQTLQQVMEKITYESVKDSIEQSFQEILQSKEYSKILSKFNRKELAKTIGHYFGLKNDEYCDFVIRQLHSVNSDEIKNAIIPYLPLEISIE